MDQESIAIRLINANIEIAERSIKEAFNSLKQYKDSKSMDFYVTLVLKHSNLYKGLCEKYFYLKDLKSEIEHHEYIDRMRSK